MKPSAHATTTDERGIRERILAAAMMVLQEDGIQGLSQVQVARRAKVRQSHLTYYFAKRHDLIEAVAIRFLEGVAHGLDEAGNAGAVAGDASPLLQGIAAVIVEPRHMRMFTGVIVEADGDPKVRAILVRVTLRFQAMLAAQLGGDDATERAGIVLANLWGLGLYDFVLRPKRPGALTASYIASITARAPAQHTRKTKR
jgi:AcrR family transcriptional regulator